MVVVSTLPLRPRIGYWSRATAWGIVWDFAGCSAVYGISANLIGESCEVGRASLMGKH